MSRQTCKRWKYSAKKTQRKQADTTIWDDMEMYTFMLHKCMILRHFGAKTVEHPVPKIFKRLKEKLTATFLL